MQFVAIISYLYEKQTHTHIINYMENNRRKIKMMKIF